jgi:hypothetical protein
LQAFGTGIRVLDREDNPHPITKTGLNEGAITIDPNTMFTLVLFNRLGLDMRVGITSDSQLGWSIDTVIEAQHERPMREWNHFETTGAFEFGDAAMQFRTLTVTFFVQEKQHTREHSVFRLRYWPPSPAQRRLAALTQT